MPVPFSATIGPDNDGITYILYRDEDFRSKVVLETYQDGDLLDRSDADECLEAESSQDPENGNLTAFLLAGIKFFNDPQEVIVV